MGWMDGHLDEATDGYETMWETFSLLMEGCMDAWMEEWMKG